MALYPDQKFSTFVDGGDLLDGDIIVGLRNGLNTQFNWPGTLPPSFIVPLSQGGTGADLIAVNDSIFSINGLGVSVLTQTLPIPVQQNITTVGTVTSGIWNGTLIDPVHGGTGVNNGTNTLTLAGSLSTSGAFSSTFNMTGATNVTFPTSGTLATTSQLPTPSALTKADDTNVTLTLGGTPATSLLQAVSLTLGWSGLLSKTRGGTGVSSVTTSPTASEFAGWDANSNLSANNFLPRFTTTASSGGTKVLTVDSAGVQEITGTLTHTVQMPDVTTLTLGHPFKIINNSSGNVTLTSSGGNTILTMAGNTTAFLTCVATTGATAASWNASYVFDNGAGVLSITGTANQVIASASTGAVTLSLPQDIAPTSSPTFAGMTLTNPYISGAGGLVNMQVLTSGTGATYTKSANVKSIIVEVIGGGGGGGGSGGAGGIACGGPGGAGGYVKHFIASAAATYTYTIGSGGTAAPAGNFSGGTGGTTTFSGGSLQATGGTGGGGMANTTTVGRANGGSGGVGTGGNIINATGSAGANSTANNGINSSGGSGASIFGGSVSTLAIGAGITATVYGAGGSGGQSSVTSMAGGAGAPGVIIVWEYA